MTEMNQPGRSGVRRVLVSTRCRADQSATISGGTWSGAERSVLALAGT